MTDGCEVTALRPIQGRWRLYSEDFEKLGAFKEGPIMWIQKIDSDTVKAEQHLRNSVNEYSNILSVGSRCD